MKNVNKKTSKQTKRNTNNEISDEQFESTYIQAAECFLKQEGLYRKGMSFQDMIDLLANGDHDLTVKFNVYLVVCLSAFINYPETIRVLPDPSSRVLKALAGSAA